MKSRISFLKQKVFLLTDPDELQDYKPVADMFETFPNLLDPLEYDEFIKGIHQRANDIRFEYDDPGILHSEAEALEAIGRKLNVDFNAAIESLRERATTMSQMKSM